MIKIEKLTQSYCLNDINCTLPSGKLIGIMGANGAEIYLIENHCGYLAPQTKGRFGSITKPLSKMNATEKSQHN